MPYETEFPSVETLARFIDHTVLAPDHTIEDVERACDEAIGYGFAAVSVAPYDIERVAKLLNGSDVDAGGAIGIPLGSGGLKGKQAEARTCVDAGADEIDMVINLVALKSDVWSDVRNEIAAVRKIAGGKVLKVILECCYLTDEEKVRACKTCLDAGVDFVKTSTGFGTGGATAQDVALMKKTVGDRAQVKAAGGIRTFQQVKAMIDAGATRIGTSAGVAIIREYQNSKSILRHD
ncbi:MAG: deoxyribose-phosphate aldolase [Planctomycetota bacterium]|nr:deoxyribose-phosphate aldolase [Planctomycetota bacterium]